MSDVEATATVAGEVEDGGVLPRSRVVALCELLGFPADQVDQIVLDGGDLPLVRVRPSLGMDEMSAACEILGASDDLQRIEADPDGVTWVYIDGLGARRVRYTWSPTTAELEEREG